MEALSPSLVVQLEREVPNGHDLETRLLDEDDALVVETNEKGERVEAYRVRRYRVAAANLWGASRVRGPSLSGDECDAYDVVWLRWSGILFASGPERSPKVWLLRSEGLEARLAPFCVDFSSRERVWENLRLSAEERGFVLGAEIDVVGEPWIVAIASVPGWRR